jgi:NADH-quinone oxidoreductase subunit H
MLALFCVVLWVRWSFLRLRIDHALDLNWKILFPIALINLMATAWWVVSRGAV